MCGVIAYASRDPKPEDLELLRRVAVESRVRGLHAFGWGWETETGPQVRKYHRLDEWLGDLDQWDALPQHLIGHARYSTSGDYHLHENNQPLQRNKMMLVFNGTLDMSRADNDGELALDQLEGGGEAQLVSWLESRSGTFAGCWLHTGTMWAYRKTNRPLWRAVDESLRAAVVASTRDIFLRAGLPIGWHFEQIPAGELQCLTD